MQEVSLAGLRTQMVLVLWLFLSAGIVSGAVEDYEGKPIASITYEPALQPFPASELAEISTLRRNEPLRMAQVREAIARLFATGRFDDIVVEAELENGQVALRLVTKGNWFVGQVTVEGAPSPPSKGQLENATSLELGSPFLLEDLAIAQTNLQRVMSNNGLFEPKIQPQVGYEDRVQQATVRFEVLPGPRARYAPPVIKGDFTRPESKIVSSTHWKGWFGWHTVTNDRTQNGLDRVLSSFRKKNYLIPFVGSVLTALHLESSRKLDYLMARVTLDRMEYDPATQRVTPYLQITQGPAVQVEAKGAKVSLGRLRQLVPIFQEQTVDRDLLVEGARDLTEYFQTKGYFNAKVDFSEQRADDGQLRIEYTIVRGERNKLVLVGIEGNHYFDEATLRERMFVARAGFIQLRHGRYSESLLERDAEAIADLYRANGFRDVAVTTRVQDNYRNKTGDVAVFVEIHENRQWFVSSVAFEGVSQENEEALRSILQSSSGQPFSEVNLAADRDNMLAYYYNNGYQSATLEYGYKESDKPAQMDLSYKITEGPHHVVREVLISGLETTHPQLVNRRIGINVGDPVSQSQMLETQRRLYDLRIFAKVQTAIQNPDGEEPGKYIVIQAEESRKYSVTVGFGAEIARIGGGQDDLTAPAGKAGFSPRGSLDISRLNFLGRAHTVSMGTRLSTLQQRVVLGYLAPQFRGHQSLDLSFSALFDTSKNVRTFSARRWEGSTQIAQKWTRSRSLFYRFAYRRVSVDPATLNISEALIALVPLLSQPVRVGVFSISYADDRRDDPTDSHKGTYNSLDLGVASKYFASETDYFRMLLSNSTYHSLTRRVVLARTLSFGMMATLRNQPGLTDRSQDIPLPERFFSGGASSIRAFPENQAGPRDLDTGFPLGGKALLEFSTELRFPLIGANVGGVLFHDAGNVYSSVQSISFRVRQRDPFRIQQPDKADFDYMIHDVGFGIRYRTPVGPVRLDLSFSPNSPRFYGCSGTRQDLLLGNCKPSNQRINRLQFQFSLGQTF